VAALANCYYQHLHARLESKGDKAVRASQLSLSVQVHLNRERDEDSV